MVKLVTLIQANNLALAIDFCISCFGELIVNQLSSLDCLERLLHGLIAGNNLVRLSVDYDLLTARFLKRLAFEYQPEQLTAKAAGFSSKVTSTEINRVRFADYFAGYQASLDLEQSLPYGEKRLSINLCDEQTMSVRFAHRKLVLSNNGSEVKDYILVRRHL